MTQRYNRFKEFYENNFEKVLKSFQTNRYFHNIKEEILINKIPKGIKVLDIGCGTGDLLKKLNPSYGVGIDLSEKAIDYANKNNTNKNISFIEGDFLSSDIPEKIGDLKFDVIILLNVITQTDDVISFLKNLHKFCHFKTRIYIYNWSRLWQPLFYLADSLGIRVKIPEENWLPPEELKKIFYLSDLQEISSDTHILFPVYIPIISNFFNKFLAHIPLINKMCILRGFTLRPYKEIYLSEISKEPKCSIIIPCRNEAGHIKELISRLPDDKRFLEYIFVEGSSTDNTEEIIKEEINKSLNKNLIFIKQDGNGKGDAVRKGFSIAKGDILGILDADISVNPEDLPGFIDILILNKAEFINGSRLVYPMRKNAMKFLNLLANKFFALSFSYLLGQEIMDTLCGTKVLWKKDYIKIQENRSYFGDFDPFGDFDLLFGASKLNLKIIDLPVKYYERTYGETNISRFRHGVLLLKMTVFAFRKLKMM